MDKREGTLPTLTTRERRVLDAVSNRLNKGMEITSSALSGDLALSNEVITRSMMSLDKKGCLDVQCALTPQGRDIEEAVMAAASMYFQRRELG